MPEFDVAIIGGGLSGANAALRAVDIGGKVCLIQRAIDPGVLPAYLPHRMLMNALQDWRRAQAGDNPVAFAEWVETLEVVAKGYWEKRLQMLAEAGVEIFHGEGSLLRGNKVLVENDSDDNLVTAKQIIIATGSQLQAIPTIPFDDEKIFPLSNVFKLIQPGEDVLVLGTGKVAVETAQFLKMFCGKVFIGDENDCLFPDMDVEVLRKFEAGLKKQKIKVLPGKKVISVFKGPDKIDVTLESGIKFSVDKIVQTLVSKPNSEKLDADRLGIRLGQHKEVLVDEKQATSVAGIYAVGSVTGRPSSDCLAEEEGRVAAGNAMGKKRQLNPDWIPLVVYSDQVMAGVGCCEATAHHKGFRGLGGRFEHIITGENGNTTSEIFKIVADRQSGKIIGGQIVSKYAAEVLPVVLLGVKKGLTVGSLAILSMGESSGFYGLREAVRDCMQAFKNNQD
jgi:dihydrolipoamide dehydrogenase